MEAQLTSVSRERVRRSFCENKTEISAVKHPFVLVSLWRDRGIIDDTEYESVKNINSKQAHEATEDLYTLLEEIERERPETIPLLWESLFEPFILKAYPEEVKQLRLNLLKNIPLENETKTLSVRCGLERGFVDLARLNRGEDCIESNTTWYSPKDFEQLGGGTVLCENVPLAVLQLNQVEDFKTPVSSLRRTRSQSRVYKHNIHSNPKRRKIEYPTTPSSCSEKSESATQNTVEESEPSDPESQPRDPESQPSDPESQPRDPESQPSDPESQPSDPESQPSDPESQPSDPESESSDRGSAESSGQSLESMDVSP